METLTDLAVRPFLVPTRVPDDTDARWVGILWEAVASPALLWKRMLPKTGEGCIFGELVTSRISLVRLALTESTVCV